MFPFADPFDSKDLSSSLRVSPIPALPGFAPIGPKGSLPAQSVIADTMPRDCSSMLPPVSRFNSSVLMSLTARSVHQSLSPISVRVFL